MPQNSTFLELKNITAYQNQTLVLDNFNLTIGLNEKVAILGPNGSGKSTLLKLISREIYPVKQNDSYIRIYDEEHFTLWELRSQIGFVSLDLQEDYTPFSTSLEVVLSGFFGSIGAHGHLVPSEHQISKAKELLSLVKMSNFENTMFQRLSTGQKRRLLLARSLVHSPNTIIFDEPTTGLDIASSAQLLQLLNEFCNKQTTLLMTTHHLDEIIPDIDRVILIKDGKIFADGDKDSILTSENLSHLYDFRLNVIKNEGWYRWQY